MARAFILAAFVCFSGSTVFAGGFECEMTYECQGNMRCGEVRYAPYIDTDWGQISMKDYGPEMVLEALPTGPEGGTWHLYAHLPAGGLFVVVINGDGSAVFTSFLHQSGSVKVVSVYGQCESRG